MLKWLSEQIIIYWDILKYLIPAIPVTLFITVSSFALAIILGSIISVIRIFKIRFLSPLAAGYVNVIRGIPLLVHIFVIQN